MTKRPFPFTTLYILLLFVAILTSWLVGLYGVEGVNSLLSEEGVRWWMRSVLKAFSAAPVGEILLVLFTLGVLRKCFTPGRRIPVWSGRAFVVALTVFILLFSLVLWGIFSGCLLSVTGHWAYSPLQQCWLPLLALLIGVPCLCYGLTNGVFATSAHVLRALGSEVSRCASAFVTLFVASQLVAVLEYSGLPTACGMGSVAFRTITIILYCFPFLYRYLR